MPIALFPNAAPTDQLIIGCLVTGMMSGGAFTLSTVPRAGLAYTWAMVLVRGDLADAVHRHQLSGDRGVSDCSTPSSSRAIWCARRNVLRQSPRAVRARAQYRDHLAAAEGLPGQRQRLAVADRRPGPAGACARSVRRGGASARQLFCAERQLSDVLDMLCPEDGRCAAGDRCQDGDARADARPRGPRDDRRHPASVVADGASRCTITMASSPAIAASAATSPSAGAPSRPRPKTGRSPASWR